MRSRIESSVEPRAMLEPKRITKDKGIFGLCSPIEYFRNTFEYRFINHVLSADGYELNQPYEVNLGEAMRDGGLNEEGKSKWEIIISLARKNKYLPHLVGERNKETRRIHYKAVIYDATYDPKRKAP